MYIFPFIVCTGLNSHLWTMISAIIASEVFVYILFTDEDIIHIYEINVLFSVLFNFKCDFCKRNASLRFYPNKFYPSAVAYIFYHTCLYWKSFALAWYTLSSSNVYLAQEIRFHTQGKHLKRSKNGNFFRNNRVKPMTNVCSKQSILARETFVHHWGSL